LALLPPEHQEAHQAGKKKLSDGMVLW